MLEIITAKNMRTIATDITNTEIAECLENVIFKQILPQAEKGALSTKIFVKNTRPKGFYQLFYSTMTSLGYNLTLHEKIEMRENYPCRVYTIYW